MSDAVCLSNFRMQSTVHFLAHTYFSAHFIVNCSELLDFEISSGSFQFRHIAIGFQIFYISYDTQSSSNNSNTLSGNSQNEFDIYGCIFLSLLGKSHPLMCNQNGWNRYIIFQLSKFITEISLW